MLSAVVAVAFIATLFGLAQSMTVQVMPLKTLCFYEELKSGERMMVGFQVGQMDVDFWINGPRDNRINHVTKSHGHEHSFEADTAGRYTYCFENKYSNLPGKDVTFYVYRDELSKSERDQINTDPLEKELLRLKEGLHSIKEEQYYLTMRERAHRDTAESTNSRVMWWSILQLMLLVAVCLWQVYYLKRFFEVKRTV